MKTTPITTDSFVSPVFSSSVCAASKRPAVVAHAHAASSFVDVYAPVVCASTPAGTSATTTTNLWLGGMQSGGFGSGADGTKRIHPGRLEAVT